MHVLYALFPVIIIITGYWNVCNKTISSQYEHSEYYRSANYIAGRNVTVTMLGNSN